MSTAVLRESPRRPCSATARGFVLACAFAPLTLFAAVGDPQIRTDHPWYPGELAFSTFERLFATQAEQYRRATGLNATNDEQRALASWLFRNTHYAHGEEGAEDWWGAGFGKGGDSRAREYWTGLFSHGFGLCGTTHSQWTAEMEHLLGHGRGRGVGVTGHNSFEVWLTGGAYGAGKWALLDHDISTVIFNADGSALLGLGEVQRDWKRLASRANAPQRQRGWLVSGLHPDDGSSYSTYTTAEYLPGYAGPPPMVHLRRGETLRRHFEPGLEDGKTFVFWGRNYNTGGIPGFERGHTWINQPDAMHGSKSGAGSKPGQVRFANAVFTYKPDFKGADYREGVVSESPGHVTFEFRSPYLIAATPPNDKRWGIYDAGCRNGLVLRGNASCAVALSTDGGATWQDCGAFRDGLDLTDRAKGFRQYLLRLGAGAKSLADSGLTITTVCQVNPAMLPRLQDNGTRVTFAASNRAVASAGPTKPHAQARVVAGAFDSPTVTLELKSPRDEPVKSVFAAAHIASGNPPRPELKFHIEFSRDGGATWKPMVKDWSIERRGDEPKDFWSQSFCYGSTELPGADAKSVRVRFSNNGGRRYLRAEAHVVFATPAADTTRVTFDWADSNGPHRESRAFTGASAAPWDLKTAANVRTRWVELEPALSR